MRGPHNTTVSALFFCTCVVYAVCMYSMFVRIVYACVYVCTVLRVVHGNNVLRVLMLKHNSVSLYLNRYAASRRPLLHPRRVSPRREEPGRYNGAFHELRRRVQLVAPPVSVIECYRVL
jgi:hypothetical protein